MALIAIYSSKGGVGKTSLAVNLAWAAASLSSRRTLLWDLDAQGAASFILGRGSLSRGDASDVIARDIAPDKRILGTAIPGLDLLPADESLRTLDMQFAELGAKKRLQKIGEILLKSYDRVIVDCPPGLGPTAEQLIRGADLIVLPSIPSALSMRAADDLTTYVAQRKKGGAPLLPVFNLVDRRRAGHRQAIEAAPDRPAIPMASAVEQMADRHAPLGAYAPRSPAAVALAKLWVAIERELASR